METWRQQVGSHQSSVTNPKRALSPRIPPLSTDEWNAAVAGRLASVTGMMDGDERPLNIFATLARHADLFQAWVDFGAMLLIGGELPARERELVILRVGWHCQSPYEWGQHATIGADIGLTEAEIARVPLGPQSGGWSDTEKLVLRATDELHAVAKISDSTWALLCEHFNEHQLIELPILVGQYFLICFAMNSFGVQSEPGLPSLPPSVS